MHTRPLPPIDPAAALRFAGFVDDRGGPDACWPWLAGLVNGYGSFRLGNRKVYAHRVAWVLAGRPEPDGPIDHTCHDPATCDGDARCHHRACCNPAHLVASSHAANNASTRRRTKAHRDRCGRGHRYTSENTRWYTSPRTGHRWRFCRACQREDARKRVRTHEQRAAEYRRWRARRAPIRD